MDVTRHGDVRTVTVYIRRANLFKGHAGQGSCSGYVSLTGSARLYRALSGALLGGLLAALPEAGAEAAMPETKMMTYGEYADAIGRSLPAGRAICFHKGWKRIIGNDGKTRVAVPLDALAKPPRKHAL